MSTRTDIEDRNTKDSDTKDSDTKDRIDHRIIYGLVEPGSTVLDLGCGNGDLLARLRDGKKVKGQGIELKQSAIFQCVEKGLRAFQLDFDSGLSSFPDKSFDYVVMNQSMQEVIHLEFVLTEAIRVGKKVVVGFPNFAHIRARVQLFLKGKTPVTNALPHYWYNTPNLHFLTVSDFNQYTVDNKIDVLSRSYYTGQSVVRFKPNLFAMNAIFVICRD